jgi:hypothetical protein
MQNFARDLPDDQFGRRFVGMKGNVSMEESLEFLSRKCIDGERAI